MRPDDYLKPTDLRPIEQELRPKYEKEEPESEKEGPIPIDEELETTLPKPSTLERAAKRGEERKQRLGKKVKPTKEIAKEPLKEIESAEEPDLPTEAKQDLAERLTPPSISNRQPEGNDELVTKMKDILRQHEDSIVNRLETLIKESGGYAA